MSGDFIDSNVILYTFDSTDTWKKDIATRVIDLAVTQGSASISFQVVQEVLHGVFRRVRPPMTQADIHKLLEEVLVPLWKGIPTQALYELALQVRQRYGFAFYDSLIVAAALEQNCDRLLTEDLQHGQAIDGLRIENPFALSRS